MQFFTYNELPIHNVRLEGSDDILEEEYIRAWNKAYEARYSYGWDSRDPSPMYSKVIRAADVQGLIEGCLGLDYSQLDPEASSIIYLWSLGLLGVCLVDENRHDEYPDYLDYVYLQVKEAVVALKWPYEKWHLRLHAKATLLKVADDFGLLVENNPSSSSWLFSSAFMQDTCPVRHGRWVLPDYVRPEEDDEDEDY